MTAPALVYDPFSYQVHEDPYPFYKRLREEAPAYFNEELGFWALSRYDDVRAALIDHDRYCSSQGFTLEDIGEFTLPMLLGMDPPDHTRLRATINRALTPRRVSGLEAPIRELARGLLARMAPQGHGDVIDDPMATVDKTLAHRRDRERKVVEALDSDPITVQELVTRVYEDVPAFLHGVACLSLEAHLIKLRDEGRVSHTGGKWAV